jgi:hypothetical protein
MGFFDPLPPPEEPAEEPRPRWLEPPGDVVPATVAGDVLLASTRRMALIVTRASVYGDGMSGARSGGSGRFPRRAT